MAELQAADKKQNSLLKSLQDTTGKNLVLKGSSSEGEGLRQYTQIQNIFSWFTSRNFKMCFCNRSLFDFSLNL